MGIRKFEAECVLHGHSDAAASTGRPGPYWFDGSDGPAVTVTVTKQEHVS